MIWKDEGEGQPILLAHDSLSLSHTRTHTQTRTYTAREYSSRQPPKLFVAPDIPGHVTSGITSPPPVFNMNVCNKAT